MKLRIENPDLTLYELSKEMTDILGEDISKSNINHLFRAIHNQAERYKGAVKKWKLKNNSEWELAIFVKT